MSGTSGLLFDIPVIAVPIHGSDRLFPVRRIYCVGRNYAGHAREMGSDPEREPPFFFQKPRDAVQYAASGTTLDHPYPSLTANYHHEIELVVALHKSGSTIAASEALTHVFGYAVGLDMTRRDLQRGMADQKKPWEMGKAFDHSAPIGPIVPANQIGPLTKGRIALSVNGEIRQEDDLSSMSWSVAEQIAKLSQAFRLEAGDIIFSGTPENVGAVQRGDQLLGEIGGLPPLSIRIV